MKRCLVEFIGTFFLVLTIGCTVINPGAGVIAPLAIGLALAVMVYAGGHISGGHYNPAVTLGVYMRGGFGIVDVIPYWVSQCAGAVVAAFAVAFLKGNPAVSPLILAEMGKPLLSEFLFTFALVYVVLNVATAKANAGNSYFGAAIGLTVMVGAFAVGNISGAAFNPAVVLGASLMGLLEFSNLIPYVAIQFAAAALASVIFKTTNSAA